MPGVTFKSAFAALILIFVSLLVFPLAKAQSEEGPAQVENGRTGTEKQETTEKKSEQTETDSRKVQTTNLAFVNCGTGLEALQYNEFSDATPVTSWGLTLSWVTSCTTVGRIGHLGFLARGVLAPVGITGLERWTANGDLVQKNDLLYRLNRLVLGVGYVSSGGIEPYLGYWYEEGRQTRENFSPPISFQPDLVSIEKIKSEGLVVGLEGVYYRKRSESISHFYGDMIVPIRSTTTNTVIPGVELHSGGIGLEGGGSFGKIYGEGSTKLTVGIQANLIILYYNGQTRRDIPGYLFVEWPPNLTFASNLILQIGGSWVSLFEK
jgi:hypothetical protein